MLQFMGLQKVRHDLATEQQQQSPSTEFSKHSSHSSYALRAYVHVLSYVGLFATP